MVRNNVKNLLNHDCYSRVIKKRNQFEKNTLHLVGNQYQSYSTLEQYPVSNGPSWAGMCKSLNYCVFMHLSVECSHEIPHSEFFVEYRRAPIITNENLHPIAQEKPSKSWPSLQGITKNVWFIPLFNPICGGIENIR